MSGWWEPKRRSVAELNGLAIRPPPVPPGYVPSAPTAQQRVLIEEPTSGWWQGKGAFGFRSEGNVPGEGQIIPLCEQATLPGPPGSWWLQWFRFNRNLDTEVASNGNFELRGRITYGVGGIQNSVEVDVMQGVQVPLVCNSVTVELVTYNPVADFPYEAGRAIAGCMFGRGSAGGALPATFTTPFEVSEAVVGLTLDVAMPDFARSVCLHTTVFPGASLVGTRLFFNGSGTTLKAVDCGDLYAELTREKGIAIPAGTNQIRLTAPAATAGAHFALQFFLAF